MPDRRAAVRRTGDTALMVYFVGLLVALFALGPIAALVWWFAAPVLAVLVLLVVFGAMGVAQRHRRPPVRLSPTEPGRIAHELEGREVRTRRSS